MPTHATRHVAGHTPANNNEGWGFALFIVALAVACWVMAWTVKSNTYLHPRDTSWRAIEPQTHEAAPAGVAGEHAAPAGATAPAGGH